MSNNSVYGVDKSYSDKTCKYFLEIMQQIDKIKVKALKNETGGICDNLTIINLAIYGLMNEKFELTETSANFRN